MSKQFDKLVTLLKELFQQDQPDLDFGLYRIMHAKADEITQFLETDLLPQVKELRQKIADESVDIGALENEVYDHLYSFFRRYYHEGDFLSKRVYKTGVYAIPYEGEEVKLHWANHDQYYIKTSEYLRDYAFTLKPGDAADPKRVHFRLMDAAEGEHGNVKAEEGKDRVFILAKEDFIALEGDELVIRFEYRPATMKDWSEQALEDATAAASKKPPTQKELLADAVSRLEGVTDPTLADWLALLKQQHTKANGERADYSRVQAHLQRYVARNTFDYFIHKDLGGFLRRELDFYIKNEVMHLDDVENETVPRVEQYLSKIKVIRRIALKLIDFLAQLEDFQKKLWLKKKFVVETNYCITLDRIPEALYPEIAANEAQREEWVKLFAIDEIEASTLTPAYSEPLTVAFLKANDKLVLDTQFFGRGFVDKSLQAQQVNSLGGTLVHSDNFQMLRLLSDTYRGKVDACYADPPYNTDAAPILYKNNYRIASWLTMMSQLINNAKSFLASDGVHCVTIDDYQKNQLYLLIRDIYGEDFILGTVGIRINPSGRVTLKGFAQAHEYAIFSGASSDSKIWKMRRTDAQMERFKESDDLGAFEWRNFRREGSSSERKSRPRRFFPIYVCGSSIRIPKMEWDDNRREYIDIEEPTNDEVAVWPIDSSGGERVWRWGIDRILNESRDIVPKSDRDGKVGLYYKYRPNEEGVLSSTVWSDKKYSATEYGTARLKALFGERNVFDFPKSIHAVEDCIDISGMRKKNGLCMDYFAGSATTAEAVINLNRKDNGIRSFILCEAGSHFDQATKPRVIKSLYSSEWKSGRPTNRKCGRSSFFKYIRLESYEDALSNLTPKLSHSQQSVFDQSPAIKEDYLLRYMLDVETRGSQSLLNIQAFADPTAYKLKVKRPGSDESREVNVDLLETFNYLIGLTVQHIAAPKTFNASFRRSGEGRLEVDGRIKQDEAGPWWFRTVTGTTPEGKRTLVVWRKLTGDPEQDNLMLDEWFKAQSYSTRDYEFDLIYVNGDNNLENLRQPEDTWKVRLTEEDFHRLMFDTTGV